MSPQQLLQAKQQIEENAAYIWPHDLITSLQQIMATPCPHPSKPLFKFDLSVEAANKNYILLM
jgi:hypothetical protein